MEGTRAIFTSYVLQIWKLFGTQNEAVVSVSQSKSSKETQKGAQIESLLQGAEYSFGTSI